MTDHTFVPLYDTAHDVGVASAARVRGGRFAVELCNDLGRIEAGWRALERDGCGTVFQNFDAFAAWTQHIAPAHAISWHVMIVRDRRRGRLVMILPLCLRMQDGLRVIEGADLEVSDYIAPVMGADFYPSTAEVSAIWGEARKLLPAADLIRLSKMPAMLGLTPNPLLRLSNVRPFRLSNFRMRLDGGPPTWAERMPEKLRGELGARRRKLSKRGRITFRTAETAAESLRFFDVMVAQRAERCRTMGRGNILADARYQAFYRDLLRPGATGAAAVMQVLMLDDEIIATGYGLRQGADFLMIFPTFVAQTWRNYSPGLQFFMESMQWAADQGCSTYDFTIGAESFKSDFGAEEALLYEYLSAASWRGVPMILARGLRGRVRQARNYLRRVTF